MIGGDRRKNAEVDFGLAEFRAVGGEDEVARQRELAAAAERLGLTNATFPIGDFDARADEWLQRLYKQSASSLRFAKRAFRLAQSADFDERLAAVERLYLDELMSTDDANEGLIAFTEKRKPAWSGK